MVPVRSILKAKKLPKSLWGEVLRTSTYLKNRSPGVDEITPYERINNVKPFLGHLRIIGARTWAHIPKKKQKKLNNRSWQGVFVGYKGNNQYRIYDPLTGKIHICRDVTVDEGNTYNPKEKKAWNLADISWRENNNAEFDDLDHDPIGEKRQDPPPLLALATAETSVGIQQPTPSPTSGLSNSMGANISGEHKDQNNEQDNNNNNLPDSEADKEIFHTP